MNRWVAGEPFKNIDGCDTVVRLLYLTEKETRPDIALLAALEEGVSTSADFLTCSFSLKFSTFRLQI